MNMENKRLGNGHIPIDLDKCSKGTCIKLHLYDGFSYKGIFMGLVNFPETSSVCLKIGEELRLFPLRDVSMWYMVAITKPIDAVVYPSDERTISVVDDAIYGGAHCYVIRECLGFNDGKTQYTETEQVVRFVQKNDDGTMIPGLQSEQLVLALLDRHEKLNARFPSEQNAKMIAGLRMFLEACEERVRNRMERGVMGELKK